VLEGKFRPTLNRFFIEPVASILSRFLSASHVTWLSLSVGILASLAIALAMPWTATVLLLLSGYFDVLDGSIARMNDSSSAFGSMIDILCDRIVEVAIIIALALKSFDMAIVALFMMGSSLICVTSFLVVGIFQVNDTHKSFYYSPGLMERAEAFLFFIAMIIFPALTVALGIIYTLLVLWTAVKRVVTK
jgi:phosphatidylglycerophosphate synthase